jgi:LysM repeat protein
MSEQHFRSTHEALHSQPQKSRRRGKKLIAVPLALAAVSSMIFGSQQALADSEQRLDKSHKAKQPQAHPRVDHHVSTAEILSQQYTVSEGDTVRMIAQKHGVSSAELLAANGLSWKTLIFAGQQLNIPAFSNGTESAEIGESITRHCVIAGDTLEAIARSYGVQPRAIMTANGLDRSSRLVVGQRLVIPDAHLMSSLPAQQTA